MSDLYGVITIRPDKMTSKCGFKYVNINPQLEILPGRSQIIYKGQIYTYEHNKLIIKIDETSIVKESMTKIEINDCVIYDQFQKSCELSQHHCGKKVVVTDLNLKEYPIIHRQSTGPTNNRYDLICYDKNNFIKFIIEWDKDNIYKYIDTSPNFKYNESELWSNLKSKNFPLYIYLDRYSKFNGSNLPYPQLNQNDANEKHYTRFYRTYGRYLQFGHNIPFNNYKRIDVIDISIINEIKITNPDDLDNFPVIALTYIDAKLLGYGFNEKVFEYQKADKNVYMMVTNSKQHRIITGQNSVLYIEQTSVDESEELILIKFNKTLLERYKVNLLIDRLEH